MKNVRRRIHGPYGRSVLLSVLLLAIASCGDGPTGGAPRPAPVARVHVSAPAATIAALDSVTLSAVAHDAAGVALSGRAMQWSSSNPAVVKVDASGRASGEAPGTATVTASAEGQSGSVTLTVTGARVASVALARDTATLQAGTTLALSATPRDRAGGALTRGASWSTSNAAAASVDAAGVVRAMAPGTAVITAASDGASAQAAITIVPAAIASLSIIPGEGTLVVGGSLALQVEARDALGNVLLGRTVEIAVSNPAVAALEAGGVLRGTGVGTVTVTATAEGRTAQANFTINPAPVASVEAIAAAPTVYVGNTVVVNAIARDANGNALTGRAVAWTTSDAAIATASGTGVVTGVAPGTVTLTATVEGRTGSVQMAVQPRPVFSVQVTPAGPTIPVGNTVDLNATARDEQGIVLTGRAVAWSTSDPAIATVSAAGVVTGVAPGTATLTATVEGRSGSVQVAVQPRPVFSVQVTPREPIILVGGTVDLSATAYDEQGNALAGRVVTWSSANPAVAPVSAVGVVTGVAQWLPVAITATVEGRTGTALVSVRRPGVNSVVVTPRETYLTIGHTVQLSAVAYDAFGNVITGRPVTWMSGSPEMVTVSATGLATGEDAGSGYVFATVDGIDGGAEIIGVVPDERDAPTITGVVVSPPSIDVTASAQTVTVEARVTDAGTGVSRVTGSFQSADGSQSTAVESSLDPVSGTRGDGTFRLAFTIPAGARTGNWGLRLNVRDVAGNTRSYQVGDLLAAGFAATFRVLDTQAPTLEGLTITPAAVNAASGGQVTVRAEVSDAGAGVDLVGGYFEAPGGTMNVMGQGGETPVSGTRAAGVFEVGFTFPPGVQAGEWPLRLSIRDRSGNIRSYTPQDLQARELPHEVTVTN